MIFIIKSKVKWRAKAMAVVAVLATFFLGVTMTSPPEAQAAASAGWCNAYTYVHATNYYVYIPSIGNGGARNCTMSSGAVSNGVLALQSGLKNCFVGIGSDPGALDGNWGPNTTSGVLAFQRFMNITADGAYGPQTHNIMMWASILTYGPNSLLACQMDQNM